MDYNNFDINNLKELVKILDNVKNFIEKYEDENKRLYDEELLINTIKTILENEFYDTDHNIGIQILYYLNTIKSKNLLHNILNNPDNNIQMRIDAGNALLRLGEEINSDEYIKIIKKSIFVKNEKNPLLYRAAGIGAKNNRKIMDFIRTLIMDKFLPEYVRCRAIGSLNFITGWNSISVLLHSLNDDKENIRLEAVKTLSTIRTAPIKDKLFHFLKYEKSDKVKFALLEAMQNRGVKPSYNDLTYFLTCSDNEIKEKAIELAGKSKDNKFISPLVEIINKNRDYRIRFGALDSIANILFYNLRNPKISINK